MYLKRTMEVERLNEIKPDRGRRMHFFTMSLFLRCQCLQTSSIEFANSFFVRSLTLAADCKKPIKISKDPRSLVIDTVKSYLSEKGHLRVKIQTHCN